MTSVDIMARRAYVFELWARRIAPREIQRLAATKHNTTERNIRRDLYKMQQWLPQLINMKYSSDERAAELIAKSRIIYERMINLAETTNHPFHKVGAYGKALAALKFEAEFLQSTGKVEKVADKIEAKVEAGPAGFNIFTHEVFIKRKAEHEAKLKAEEDAKTDT